MKTYNPTDAQTRKIKAHWNYAKRAYSVDKVCKVGQEVEKPDPKTDTTFYAKKTKTDFCYIVADHISCTLWISWRGTRGLKAWKENFDAIDKKHIGKMRFHEGLWEGYIEFEQWLFAIVAVWADRGYKVKIQGHSRGGGLAPISKYQLDCHFEENFSTQCYAAMRCGNKEFRDWCEKYNADLDIFNIDRDIVPNLPMKVADYVDPVDIVEARGVWVPFAPAMIYINHRPPMYTKRIKKL
jgi:hypothetical protein